MGGNRYVAGFCNRVKAPTANIAEAIMTSENFPNNIPNSGFFQCGANFGAALVICIIHMKLIGLYFLSP